MTSLSVLRKLVSLAAMFSIVVTGILTTVHDHNHGVTYCCDTSHFAQVTACSISGLESLARKKTACCCDDDQDASDQEKHSSPLIVSSDSNNAAYQGRCAVCRMDFEESVVDAIFTAPDSFDLVCPATTRPAPLAFKEAFLAWLSRGPPQTV